MIKKNAFQFFIISDIKNLTLRPMSLRISLKLGNGTFDHYNERKETFKKNFKNGTGPHMDIATKRLNHPSGPIQWKGYHYYLNLLRAFSVLVNSPWGLPWAWHRQSQRRNSSNIIQGGSLSVTDTGRTYGLLYNIGREQICEEVKSFLAIR